MLSAASLADWDGFADSWNRLEPDLYMADGGRYRRRRHAVFRADADGVVRSPHQPHYQSRDHNPLNGGIERWFAPLSDAMAAHPALTAILGFCRHLFDGLVPGNGRRRAWHVELHQFRIEAGEGQMGLPTPEGLHRDGVDWVMMLLVRRDNIAGGTTSIHDPAGRELGSFTLTAPLDAMIVDDSKVCHAVTPVELIDASRPGRRDVLVVTFRRGGAL